MDVGEERVFAELDPPFRAGCEAVDCEDRYGSVCASDCDSVLVYS